MKRVIVKGMTCILLMSALTGCSDDEQPTVMARKADFNVAVKANGELASAHTAFLSPPSVGGMWRYKLTFLVPEGAMVKKDQVVARFEPTTLSDKLKRKRDEFRTIEKELENENPASGAGA